MKDEYIFFKIEDAESDVYKYRFKDVSSYSTTGVFEIELNQIMNELNIDNEKDIFNPGTEYDWSFVKKDLTRSTGLSGIYFNKKANGKVDIYIKRARIHLKKKWYKMFFTHDTVIHKNDK